MQCNVLPSLRKVATAEGGLSDEARQFASGALFELDEEARQKAKEAAVAAKAAAAASINDEEVEHVMLSYSWDDQEMIARIAASLKTRQYNTWLDTEQMKGSLMDAMSDAVEGAEVVLYGVSKGYKESANCRLEANYAHQQG